MSQGSAEAPPGGDSSLLLESDTCPCGFVSDHLETKSTYVSSLESLLLSVSKDEGLPLCWLCSGPLRASKCGSSSFESLAP